MTNLTKPDSIKSNFITTTVIQLAKTLLPTLAACLLLAAVAVLFYCAL
jgi:hypothetical protein